MSEKHGVPEPGDRYEASESERELMRIPEASTAAPACENRASGAMVEVFRREMMRRFVRFAHQPTGPVYRITGTREDGMLQLEGMMGCFAPHIFIDVPGHNVVVEKTPAGPRLLLGDICIRSWLGTKFDEEADALAARINERIDSGREPEPVSNHDDVQDAAAGER